MSAEDSGDNWILGVILGLAGSILINTGNNIQSLGLQKLQKQNSKPSPTGQIKEKIFPVSSEETTNTIESEIHGNADKVTVVEKEMKPSESKTWVIGTIIFVGGTILNFYSFAFAAQSMLASLESVQFVTNLIFGKFMLGAIVTKTMLSGTILAVVGTLIAVQNSSKAALDLNTEELIGLYGNLAYIVYVIVVVILLVLLDQIYRCHEKRADSDKPLRFSHIIMALSYSIWSALVGTQSVVQAKVIAELLTVHSRGDENVFKSWFTYVTIIAWFVTAVIWLKRLNDALSKFNPLFIIPLLQCSFIFFAIISGGLYFKEFDTFTFNQWIGFWCGVLVMFVGLALLTPRNLSQNEALKEEIAHIIVEASCASSVDIGINQLLSPRHNKHSHSIAEILSPRKILRNDEEQHSTANTVLTGSHSQSTRGAKKKPRYILQTHTSMMTAALNSAVECRQTRERRQALVERARSLLQNTQDGDSFFEQVAVVVQEMKNELGTVDHVVLNSVTVNSSREMSPLAISHRSILSPRP